MGNVFKLNNGSLLLSTEAPGGVYNSAQLKKIATLADGDTAIVKATEDQRLALFVKEEAVAKVAAELQSVGLGVRHYQDGLHQPVNCLGALCPMAAQDAMGLSMDLAEELKTTQLDSPLKIGINGCGRCCVATHTLDISIVGDTNGYRISLGGKNSQIPEMATFMAEGVPAAKLPKLVAKVIAVYKELAQKDETLQELMERAGSKSFIDALHPYSQDAAQGDPFASMSEESAPMAEEEFGDVGSDLGPAVDDDLGFSGTLDAGPNFDDVGPSAGDDVGVLAVGELEMDDTVVSDDDLVLSDDATETMDFEELAISEAADEIVEAPPAAEVVMREATLAESSDEEEFGSEMSADEVDEDEADAFEAKLNESIAEEEGMPEAEDLNAGERLEAMRLVEASSDLPSVDDGQETLSADFDNLEIEHEFEFEPEPEMMSDFEDEADCGSSMDEPPTSAGTGFDLAGVDVTADGRVALTFASGANVSIDPRSLKGEARKDLVMGGKKISLRSGAKGLSIEVDGVAIFLPRHAA